MVAHTDISGITHDGDRENCPHCARNLSPNEIWRQRNDLLAALKGMLEWARRVKECNPGMEVANAVNAVSRAESTVTQ